MFKGKLNKLRTYAMFLMLIGMGVMYLSLLINHPIFMTIIMLIGFFAVIISASSYFWIGMISSRAVLIECPTCNKVTKMLGKNDECMFCRQKLTLDPAKDPSRLNTN